MTTYSWATDAAAGKIEAVSAQEALEKLIAEGEWAPVDSTREANDIADGAYLMIGEDAPGERLISRSK